MCARPPKVPKLKIHFLLRWMNLDGKLFLSHICLVQQGFHKVVNDITPSNCSQCSSDRHVSLFRDYAGFKEWCHTLNTQICTDSRQTRTAPWSASENFRWNTETQIREALSCRICLQWALHTWTYVSLLLQLLQSFTAYQWLSKDLTWRPWQRHNRPWTGWRHWGGRWV